MFRPLVFSMKDTELEVFRAVVGYEGRYVINRNGDVVALINPALHTGKNQSLCGYTYPRKLSNWVGDTGHVRVQLQKVGAKRPVPVYLHRLLYETFVGLITAGKEIDHINRDRSDNSLENLRLVTRLQNCGNKKAKKGVQYKGVSKTKSNTWFATIGNTVDGVSCPKYLGCFDSPVKAAVAYDLAALKKYGEYAYTNFIKTADTLYG